MATHGIIDMRAQYNSTAFAGGIGSTFGQRINYLDYYVSIFNFLTSSFGQSLGAQRIAYNTGSRNPASSPNFSTGSGADYWETTNKLGDNAWSVWKFSSASVPFYMLMQVSIASNWQSSPGSDGAPATISANTTIPGIGIGFAMRADGGNPWNGATGNAGADSKNYQVWTSGSSQLFVWPRSNSFGGTHATQMQNLIPMIWAGGGFNSTGGPSVGSRMHVVADFENFAVAYDDGGDNTYNILHFGRYTPRSGSGATVPYIMVMTGNGRQVNDPCITIGSTAYGSTSGNGLDEGGVAHPTILTSGTRSAVFSGLNEFWSTTHSPSNVLGNTVYDEFPILCGIDESPWFAYIGQLDYNFIRWVYGVNSMDVNPQLTRVAVGNAAQYSAKVTIPWDGLTIPGTNSSRSGVMF